jgi:hypothetical protein
MTPTTPRKPRSGRRQFPPGTDREWQQVMAMPHVARAMADPAIQQALMQHMQATAPAGPPVASGPTGMKKGGPLRFQTGGSAQEADAIQQEIAALSSQPQTSATAARLALLRTQQTRLFQQQMQPAAALPVGGGQSVSSSSMAGLGKLAATGPPTLGNTAVAAGVGALMGAGTTRMQGTSALVGAGTAGLLNYLIRKYGKQSKSGAGGATGGSGQPGSGSQTGGSYDPNAKTSNYEPELSQPAGGPPGGLIRRGPLDPQTEDVSGRNPDQPTGFNPAQLDPSLNPSSESLAATLPADAPDLVNLPNEHSGSSMDPLLDTGGFATGGGGDDTDGLAGGGPVPAKRVLLRKPAGKALGMPLALPVLHTTIVIAPKAAGKKKAAKGDVIQARKPGLLPPRDGPGGGEGRPKAHGRVQVPRGSGAAIKGKRFGGIY